MILCFTRAGLVGLDIAEKVLLQFTWRSRSHASVNAALPVVSGNLVFLSASYNTGATLLDLSGPQPEQLWSSDEALSNHYATSVLKDGYLYGFHGRQEHGQSLRCVEFKTGKVRWSTEDLGAGTLALVGDRLLVLREKRRSNRRAPDTGWVPAGVEGSIAARPRPQLSGNSGRTPVPAE